MRHHPSRVGLITLSSRQGLGRALEYHKMAYEELRRYNIELLPLSDVITSVDDLHKALEGFRLGSMDCLIVLVSSMVSEELLRPLMLKDIPVLIWDVGDPGLISTASSLQLKGLLRRIHAKYGFIYGRPREGRVASHVASFVRASKGYVSLYSARVGVLGDLKKGSSHPDALEKFLKHFGIEFVKIETTSLKRYVEGVVEDELRGISQELHERGIKVSASPPMMLHSLKLYLAIRRLAYEKKLDALLFDCRRELSDYGTLCLASSLLWEDGFPIDCYADLYGLMTAMMAFFTTGHVVFSGFISNVEVHDRIIRILSCGGAPISMAPDPRNVLISNQRSDWGKGVSLSFSVKRSRVTLLRLMEGEDSLALLIASGESFPVPRERLREDVEIWPHLFLKLDGNPQRLLSELDDGKVHVILGDHRRDFVGLARLCELKSLLI
ncbi:MAG: hypothetical protein J7L11_03925 [Thermoprotei archaeon]|nr:hypothetical protein [Thermoprotei archaeon]